MTMFKSKIIVKLKPGIKDTKGLTLEHAINCLEKIKNLSCKVGSVYYINFDAHDQVEALKFAEKITEDILINNIVETYEIRYLEEVEE